MIWPLFRSVIGAGAFVALVAVLVSAAGCAPLACKYGGCTAAQWEAEASVIYVPTHDELFGRERVGRVTVDGVPTLPAREPKRKTGRGRG